MNRIQIATVVLYGALFFFAPYLKPSPEDMIFDRIVSVIAIGLMLVNVIYAIVSIAKEKENRKYFIFYGLRNILLLPAAFLFAEGHTVGWEYKNEVVLFKYESWYLENWVYAAAWALGVIAIFALIEHKMGKK